MAASSIPSAQPCETRITRPPAWRVTYSLNAAVTRAWTSVVDSPSGGDPALAMAGEARLDLRVEDALPVAAVQLAQPRIGHKSQAELLADGGSGLQRARQVARVQRRKRPFLGQSCGDQPRLGAAFVRQRRIVRLVASNAVTHRLAVPHQVEGGRHAVHFPGQALGACC